MSDRIMNSRKTRRRLAPSFGRPPRGDRNGGSGRPVRSQLAASVPGRPGQSASEAALARAEAEIARLRATVTEQAVALHLHEGKAAWD